MSTKNVSLNLDAFYFFHEFYINLCAKRRLIENVDKIDYVVVHWNNYDIVARIVPNVQSTSLHIFPKL